MRYSNLYKSYISKVFDLRPINNSDDLPSLKDLNIIKYLVFDTSPKEFEIPTMAVRNLPANPSKIAIPLYVTQGLSSYKTSDKILEYLFCSIGFNAKLGKIELIDGGIYYGCKGIVLNANYEPLMLSTFKCHHYEENDSSNGFIITENIVHISPTVVLNQDNSLYKAILKKMVPFFLEEHIQPRASYIYHNIAIGVEDSVDTSVVVEDLSKYFYDPSPLINTGKNVGELYINDMKVHPEYATNSLLT